jgi:hypothetical protein
MQLTPAEQADYDAVVTLDFLDASEYDVERGPLSGHAFASNGYSMVRDLTDGRDIEADSIDEADREVAKHA